MAKKTKRSRRKVARTTAAETRRDQPTPVAKATVLPRASAPAKVDLAREYSYVFTDLRKIAIIAAIMFVLLFALAFVLK